MKQDIESSQIRLKNGWKHFDNLKRAIALLFLAIN